MDLLYSLSLASVIIAFIVFVVLNKNKSSWKNAFLLKQNDVERNLKEIKSPANTYESRLKKESEALRSDISNTNNSVEALKISIEKENQANYMKNVFLTNVSNEIRNPLNGILGFANLLKTEMAHLNRDDLYDFGDSISKSGESLLRLLTDIIDISRIEVNDISFDLVPCDLQSIISTSVSNYKKVANEKGLQIILDNKLSYSCLSDKETLSRIINSVIDNSVRFTDKGYIKISIEANKDLLKLSIKDTGVGIDPSYIPMVFEPYRQETLGYSTKYQGAGLSLPLAKKALNLLEGSITIESEKGHGTEVCIIMKSTDLIDDQAPKKEEKKKAGDAPPWYNKNVLLVEDDKINQILFTKLLTGSKNLIVCGSGEDALDKLTNLAIEQFKVDFVLMDINLPGEFDGISLMYRIKEDWQAFNEIPFIAQTAYAMSNEREKLIGQGFDEYISKPIKKTELTSVVEKVLTSQS